MANKIESPVHQYYLVQRLTRANSNKPGFDGFFRCEYMGSSEFEFGAIPKSLKRIRAAGDVVRKHREITFKGVTRKVWFVGSLATLATKVDDFEKWLAGDCRGKESSYFPENFTGRDSLFDRPASDWMADVVAWWSLDDDVLFTLDEEIADLAVQALKPKEA